MSVWLEASLVAPRTISFQEKTERIGSEQRGVEGLVVGGSVTCAKLCTQRQRRKIRRWMIRTKCVFTANA